MNANRRGGRTWLKGVGGVGHCLIVSITATSVPGLVLRRRRTSGEVPRRWKHGICHTQEGELPRQTHKLLEAGQGASLPRAVSTFTPVILCRQGSWLEPDAFWPCRRWYDHLESFSSLERPFLAKWSSSPPQTFLLDRPLRFVVAEDGLDSVHA